MLLCQLLASELAGLAAALHLLLQVGRFLLQAKQDVLTLKDSIMLDMNDNGGLDSAPGANRQLRNYRVALDMNKPGVSFRASNMIGRMLLVRIKHEEYPLGSGNLQERPAGVSAI